MADGGQPAGAMPSTRETIVPVLCRFWQEDDVWNGIAEDMAVAVFGETFEEARENLRSAIESHFASAIGTGELSSMLDHLQSRAFEYGFLSLSAIAPGSPDRKSVV